MIEHGFLGYDASFMLDFVVTAPVAIVPVLLYSLYVVKYQHRYQLHRTLQLIIGLTLLVTVTAFEVETQWIRGGWANIVNKNPESPRLVGEAFARAQQVLRVHLIFAISTPLLWGTTLVLAWNRFGNPPRPGQHSRLHKTLGWLSVIDFLATAITGAWFYYVAFVL